MYTPNKDGVSRHASTVSAAKQFKKMGRSEEQIKAMFPELIPVEVEKGTEYLLNVFENLNTSRSTLDGAPQAISFSELKAYCELMSEDFSPWEIETLRAMDKAYVTEALVLIRDAK